MKHNTKCKKKHPDCPCNNCRYDGDNCCYENEFCFCSPPYDKACEHFKLTWGRKTPTQDERNKQAAIGARIRVRRKALGMTQKTLALKLGALNASCISKHEAGDVPIPEKYFPALAEALGVSVGWLKGE